MMFLAEKIISDFRHRTPVSVFSSEIFLSVPVAVRFFYGEGLQTHSIKRQGKLAIVTKKSHAQKVQAHLFGK